MGADASIYSMIRPPAQQPGPLDQYTAMMQLRAMGNASQLHGLQVRKLTGDLAEEDAFKSRIADWIKAGGAGDLPPEAYAASPSRAAAFDKTRLEGQKTRGEIKKNDVELHGKQVQQLRDDLAKVTDDNGLMRLRTDTIRIYGPDAAAKMPQSVSDPAFPEWQRTNLLTADKLLEYKNPKYEFKSDGKTEALWQVNPQAGKVGAVEGGPTITKQMSPAEADASRRGWAQLGQPIFDEQRGVWVMRPTGGGGPAAAPGASAAPAGSPSGAAPASAGFVKIAGLPAKTADVAELRKEFNALPEVKAFRDVVPVVEAARAAPNTRAGDIQLGYAVGKILDPNSVVREGEIKMVGDAAPIYEKYKGEFDSVANGTGRFTPETRKQLLAMLDNAVTQREGAYKAADATYRGIADKNGIPHDQVIISPMKRTAQPEAKPGAPQMFDKMPDAAQYSGKRMQADDGTIYLSDGKRWVRQAR